MSSTSRRLTNFRDNVVLMLEEEPPPSVDGGEQAVQRLLDEAHEWVHTGQAIGYFRTDDESVESSAGTDRERSSFGRALEDAWSDLDASQIRSLALIHFASEASWRSETNRLRSNFRSDGASTTRREDLAWLFSNHDGLASDPSTWRVTYSERALRRMHDVMRLRAEASTAQADVQTYAEDDEAPDDVTPMPLHTVADIEDYRRKVVNGEPVAPLGGTATVEQAEWFAVTFNRLTDALRQVSPGRDDEAELALAALLAGQHILVDFEPGNRPWDMVRSLSTIISGSFSAIRASGISPSDVTGVTIYNNESHRFEFHRGPLFATIVLIEELPDAEKITRHAVFEIMTEGQITVDGISFTVGSPFIVVAASEIRGTELSLADRDKFGVRIYRSHLSRTATVETLRGLASGTAEAAPLITASAISDMQLLAQTVSVGTKPLDLILDIIEASRDSSELSGVLGFDAVTSLLRVSQVFALAGGRPFVDVRDVLRAVPPTLEHRVELTTHALQRGRTLTQAVTAAVQTALERSTGDSPDTSVAL